MPLLYPDTVLYIPMLPVYVAPHCGVGRAQYGHLRAMIPITLSVHYFFPRSSCVIVAESILPGR